MRTCCQRVVCALVAVVVALGSGCSSAPTDGSVPLDEPTGAAPADVSASSSEIDLVGALEQTLRSPSRFDVTTEGGDGPQLPTLVGEFDGTWSSTATMAPPTEENNFATDQVLWQVIDNDAVAYFTIPVGSPAGESLPFADDDPMALAAGRWAQINHRDLDPGAGFRPSAFEVFDDLEEAFALSVTVAELDPLTIADETLRMFHLELPEPESPVFAGLEAPTLVVGIDAAGFVRRVETKSELLNQIVTFADFGNVPAVALPGEPIDITDMIRDLNTNNAPRPTAVVQHTPSPTPAGPSTGEAALLLLASNPELSVFRALLTETGLDDYLVQAGHPWTFYAPTNMALEAMSVELAERRQDPVALRQFVSRHISPRAVELPSLTSAENLIAEREVATLNADFSVLFVASSQSVTINDDITILVSTADQFSNTLHVLSSALG